MDPVTTAAEIVVEVLTEPRARDRADALLAMTEDSAWDDWSADHLLASRPEKWERSLIAYRGDEPVGWAIVSRTERAAHLHHLVVATDVRGRRIGERLVAEALKRNSDCGALTLKVHPSNEGALRFYDRLGFTKQGTSPSGYIELARDTRSRGTA